MASAVLLVVLLLQGGARPAPAAVSGQLQMSDGSPAPAVRVAALNAPGPTVRPSEGQNYYSTQIPVGTTLTDEAGRYRFTNLPPGRYLIVAGPVAQATYYPSTTDIDAATVVALGAESVEGIDFRLLRSPGARVRGRVSPPPASGEAERAVLSGTSLGELLEAPVREDGTFEFGRVPRGEYLVTLSPQPSGMGSHLVQVKDEDVVSVDLARPRLHTVSGRIVVARGPLPNALMGFSTALGYARASIRPDGTFTARLHPAQHRVELGGMPVGYSLASVKVGDGAAGDSITVRDADITGVVVTVAAPSSLPRLTGRVEGPVPPSARVEATGPINGMIDAEVRADGSFEFDALPPGLYRLRVPHMSALAPVTVVVDAGGANVRLSAR